MGHEKKLKYIVGFGSDAIVILSRTLYAAIALYIRTVESKNTISPLFPMQAMSSRPPQFDKDSTAYTGTSKTTLPLFPRYVVLASVV
jgi:hypothetical protein